MRRALLLLLLLAAPCWGQPPKLVIPPEIRPSGQYARMTPETDAASVLYVGLDRLDPFPPELLRDQRLFVLDCYGKPEGRYRFAAVAASKTGEQVRSDFVLVIGTPTPTPVPPAPPIPPVPPPPEGKYGISRISYDAALKVDNLAEATNLGNAHDTLASKVAAGVHPTPAAILQGWRDSNRGALGGDAAAMARWANWGAAVSARIKALNESGQLKSDLQWSEMFFEVADGLEYAAKAGVRRLR